MPISAVGNSRRASERGFTFLDRRSAEHGFTLIELMVVVTIIGLASAVVVLTIPDPRGRLADEASQFAARTRAAHDSAIVEARPVSVWISAGGYGFDRRSHGAWQPISEKPFKVSRWSAGTRPALTQERDRVVFDPTGFADRPLDVQLTRDGVTQIVRIGGDGSVKIDG